MVHKQVASSITYTMVYENVRSIGAMLAPDELTWITEMPAGQRDSLPYVIHLSCLAHYTPHIALLAQKVLNKVGIDAPILGGPEHCCGTLARYLGDPDLEEIGAKTGVQSLRRAKPTTVVSICPDCDESFNKFMPQRKPFQAANVSEILVRHLDSLRTQFKPLKKKVVIHGHDANPERVQDIANIRTVLEAIPDLEILEAKHATSATVHCSVLTSMPLDDQARMRLEAEQLGADILVVPYHSCYRQHCMLELEARFEVHHCFGVVAMALGISFEEPYKELRLLDDFDEVVERLRPEVAKVPFPTEELESLVEFAIFPYEGDKGPVRNRKR